MKSWRELSETEQAEAILAGAELCVRCAGHGTYTVLGGAARAKETCFVCGGKGYLTEGDASIMFTVNDILSKLGFLRTQSLEWRREVPSVPGARTQRPKVPGRKQVVSPPYEVPTV